MSKVGAPLMAVTDGTVTVVGIGNGCEKQQSKQLYWIPSLKLSEYTSYNLLPSLEFIRVLFQYGQYTYHVAIVNKRSKGISCDGVIISNKLVMTMKKCLT